MRAYISFCGFYSTWLDPREAINSAHEYLFDNLSVDCLSGSGFSNDELEAYAEACNDAFSFKQYAEKMGKEWVSEYESQLQALDGSLRGVRLMFVAIRSPREYNFISDSCEVEISESDLRRVREYAARIARNEDFDTVAIEDKTPQYFSFAEYIEKRMRPRDGFAPFYSNDVNQWGAVNEWDEAQTECLFDFVLNEREVIGLDYCNEDLIARAEEYATENDPDPEEWIKAYRAEHAE